MRIRIYNCKVLTLCGEEKIFEGEVWVNGTKIEYVGPAKKPEGIFDRSINAAGKLVMPSFKNTHAHSAMVFLRSYADDLPLDLWLNDSVFPMEDKLREEYMGDLVKLAIMEYLTSGITAAMDMYFYAEETAKAAVSSGFRMVMVSTLNDFSESAEEMERAYLRYNSFDPLIGYRLGFHAEYTTSVELMRDIAKISQKHGAPVFMHAQETQKETRECIERHGKTPVALFDSLGLFDHGGAIYHGVWLNDEDMDILRKRDVGVVINSASNLKLASGIAPTKKLLERGIRLGIGTDGAASNNCLDMFRELFLFTALAKVREMDASVVPPAAALHASTDEGARIMGLSDCGGLAAGQEADLILLDLKKPNMQPENNILKNIVYSGSKDNVYLTMAAGRILYENGEFLTIDRERVYDSVRRITDEMKR